jgi:membrane protein
VKQVEAQAESRVGETTVPLAWHLHAADVMRRTLQQSGPHHLGAFAGNLAYNAFVAIFPFVLFLLSVLRAVRATDLVNRFVALLAASLPVSAGQFLRDQLQPEMLSRLPNPGWLSVLLALGSLWAVSAVFRAVAAAMNVMYESAERRPFWRQVGLSLMLSVVAASLMLAAVVLILVGARIGAAVSQNLHLGLPIDLIWSTVQWLMLVVCAFGAFALMYYCGPDVRRPIRAVGPGALAATLAWLVFSVLFSGVLDRFGAFLVDPLYGWFAGIIVLLLYLYWSAFIFLVGAEVNCVVEMHRAGRSASRLGTKDRRETIGCVRCAVDGEPGCVETDSAVHGER